jgi:hypothetical protein
MISNMPRESTIIGHYMCWIEPVLFPASFIPLLGATIKINSAAGLLSFAMLPLICIVLFKANIKFYKTIRLKTKTTVFSVGSIIHGAIVLFFVAAIPLVSLGFSSDFSYVKEQNSTDRMLVAVEIAILLASAGVIVRIIALAMEELRYLSKALLSDESTSKLRVSN